MRCVIQRVSSASVVVEGQTVGAIENGLLVLLGICHEDTEADAQALADKLIKLRIFNDANGKMNLPITEIENSNLLVISQFTLYAATKKGNRPSFLAAAAPSLANALYRFFIAYCTSALGKKVESGVFGADMKVSLLNDGPVTILIDTKDFV
jgi:D-tyrosyl-tRNA(Tyr) deacylase